MHTIGSALLGSPLLHGSGEVFENSRSGFPIYTGVGDRNTLLQSARTFGWYLLVTLVDVRFDHDADNAGLAFADLVGDLFSYYWLVLVVLVGVSCLMSTVVSHLSDCRDAYHVSSPPS